MAFLHAVRVHDLSDDTRTRLCSFAQAIPGSYVFARETDAARAHFQGWIRCDIKPQAMRVRLRKAFPECIGNKGYSLTQVKDEEAYKRYILKGTREEIAHVVCYSGIQINEEFLAAEHRAYWSKAEKATRSNRPIVDEVEEWVKLQKWDDINYKEKDVAQRVCDVIVAKKKALNMFYARGVYNTVMYRASESFRDYVIAEIISKR